MPPTGAQRRLPFCRLVANPTTPETTRMYWTNACWHSSERDCGPNEMDHGGEALVGFLVARGHAAERLDFAEEMFDQMTPAVHMEITGDELLAGGFGRNDGNGDPFVQFGPQPINFEG